VKNLRLKRTRAQRSLTAKHPAQSAKRMPHNNVLTRSLLALSAALGLIARCMSCYIQLRNEQRELSGLNHRSLRDIGLTEYDVSVDVQRPVWRRCWRRAHA
jgi:uncharacterized protein YjiS (DUF1127 family)